MTKKKDNVKEEKKNMEEKPVEEKVETMEEVKDETTEEKPKKENKKKEKTSQNESKELLKKIEELEQEKLELKDSMLRRAAEFENYKRRTEKEQSALIKYASERFILGVLPVYNDLERSISHLDDENNIDALKEGLKLVFNNFKKILEENEIKKIEAKGSQFDFNLHEALMQQPSEDVPPHTVLEEIEPGYTYKDKVIKHAKVIVSQEVIKPEPEETEEKTKEKEN